MTDGQLLLLVLVVLTLYDCLRWVPGRSWAWQSRGPARWVGSLPAKLLQRRGGAMVLLSPLPPPQAHVITAAWPCAPHEHGLCVWDDESGRSLHIPWEQVRPRAEKAVLHLTADCSVRCIHATSAREWTALITSWPALPQGAREASFAARASALLDAERLKDGAAALHRQTKMLRLIGGIIFWWTFFAVPLCYSRYGDLWPTFAVTGTLLVLMLTQAVLLFRQVRRHRALRADAIAHVLGSALLPPASMRAADWVCAELSPEAHPLAALKAWGDPTELERHAAVVWRRTRWPSGKVPSLPWEGPETMALRAFLKDTDLDVSSFEAAPAPQEGCTRWCPRCLTQYSAPAESCSDCGVKLEPLPIEAPTQSGADAPAAS